MKAITPLQDRLGPAEEALNQDCSQRNPRRELETLLAAAAALSRGEPAARALGRLLGRVLATPSASLIRRHLPGSLFEYGCQGQLLVESDHGLLSIRPFSDGTFGLFSSEAMATLVACSRRCPGCAVRDKERRCFAMVVDSRLPQPRLEPQSVICRGRYDCRLKPDPASQDEPGWKALKARVTSILEHGCVSVSDLEVWPLACGL